MRLILMKVKLKIYGSRKSVEHFKKYLDDKFYGVFSETKQSDRDGYHAFATIEVPE